MSRYPNIDRLFNEWHRATKAADIDALMAIYAEDAVFESPTITLVLGRPVGVVKGRKEIGDLLREVYKKLTGKNEWYRTGDYFSNGKQLVWEYPRETPNGQQAEIIEVMVDDGASTKHFIDHAYLNGFVLFHLVGNRLTQYLVVALTVQVPYLLR